MKKVLLILLTFLVFPILGVGNREEKKRTVGRPRYLERHGYPDPGLRGPNDPVSPRYKNPTTLVVTYDDKDQPPLVCNVDKSPAFAGRFDVPPLLTGLVDGQVMSVRDKQPDILPVAVMVHLTSRDGSIDTEFRKLLAGERSTKRQFLSLLSSHKKRTGLESVKLELPDDGISPVRIVCDKEQDVLKAPSLEELFEQLFEGCDEDSRAGRELKRLKLNTQFQTLRLNRGERNHFRVLTNPRWQRVKGDSEELEGHYGNLNQFGGNRFLIVPTKEVPREDPEPTGLLWLCTQITAGWKDLTGS